MFQASVTTLVSKPVITDVKLSRMEIRLDESFTISITGTNQGDSTDLQTVSIGFPNMTSADHIAILHHNFTQTPVIIQPGDSIGSQYAGPEKPMPARHPAVEAYSRPWESGKTYSIDLQVTPASEGRFIIFVKSVGLPHASEQSHYPQQGALDYQQEFAELFWVQVAKS